MATLRLSDLTSLLNRGHEKKDKPAAFASQQEAYSFVRRVYKETGGATPALKELYKEYVKTRDSKCQSDRLGERRVSGA